MWWGFLAIGIIDFGVRVAFGLTKLSDLWTKPLADNIVVLFIISVAALAIGERAAEEASDEETR